MRRVRALLALLLPLLAGCIGEEREQALGDQIAMQASQQLALVTDSALNRYVQTLGIELARVSARPELPYRFYIIDSPAVNAFALPGGHIYINRGLLERTENVSELAAVLAHEIAHVAERHGAEMLERRLRTGSVVSVLYRLFLGDEPSLIRESALRISDAAWSAHHSRSDELEADRLAIEYVDRAGLDPTGMTTFLSGLLREEEQDPRFLAPWFATHPMTGERIARAQQFIQELPAHPGQRRTRDVASYGRFLERLNALPPPPLLLPPGHPSVEGGS